MSRVAVSVTFVLIGVVLVAVGEPMRRRRVQPNMLYGLRTRATLADESVWFDANQYAGRLVALAGIVICVAGASLPWLTTGFWATEALVGLTLLCTTASSLLSIRHANRLLAARAAEKSDSASDATARQGGDRSR